MHERNITRKNYFLSLSLSFLNHIIFRYSRRHEERKNLSYSFIWFYGLLTIKKCNLLRHLIQTQLNSRQISLDFLKRRMLALRLPTWRRFLLNFILELKHFKIFFVSRHVTRYLDLILMCLNWKLVFENVTNFFCRFRINLKQ